MSGVEPRRPPALIRDLLARADERLSEREEELLDEWQWDQYHLQVMQAHIQLLRRLVDQIEILRAGMYGQGGDDQDMLDAYAELERVIKLEPEQFEEGLEEAPLLVPNARVQRRLAVLNDYARGMSVEELAAKYNVTTVNIAAKLRRWTP